MVVPWHPSQISFSVRCEKTALEYNGTSINSLFAQRRNFVRPSFLRMVADILRFNRSAPALLASGCGSYGIRAVRDLVQARTGSRPSGPIKLLTHLRYFGYCMNPVSFYYCFNESGDRLETIVAEITNTPWKERHQYVMTVPAGAGIKRFRFDKEFRVSPFLPMDMQYRWSFTEPLDRLFVHMQNHRNGERVFDATLALEQEPVSARALLGALAAPPPRVS